MKIITWNILDKNKKIEASLDWIFGFNPEVICFQEYPSNSMRFLNQKGYSFVTARDCNYLPLNKKNQLKSLLVIGIKKEIKYRAKVIPLEIPAKNIIQKITNLRECIEGLKITIRRKGKEINLFNIHLSVAAGHSTRLKQINKILEESSKEKIICGDLNNFGHPLYNWLIGFILNFKPKDYLINEKRDFEKIYKRNNLKNLFSGKVTYPLTRQQLDHILISKDVIVKKKKVLKKGSNFSDHLPLLVEIDF